MFFAKPILATILACGLAAPACEPDFTSRSKAKRADTPIELKADCSFKDVDAGHLDNLWATQTMTGNPVRDRGKGRVAQVVGTSGLCSYNEVLLFVDCNADESLIISGKGTPPRDFEVAGLIENRVETIQPPYGRSRSARNQRSAAWPKLPRSTGYAPHRLPNTSANHHPAKAMIPTAAANCSIPKARPRSTRSRDPATPLKQALRHAEHAAQPALQKRRRAKPSALILWKTLTDYEEDPHNPLIYLERQACPRVGTCCQPL